MTQIKYLTTSGTKINALGSIYKRAGPQGPKVLMDLQVV